MTARSCLISLALITSVVSWAGRPSGPIREALAVAAQDRAAAIAMLDATALEAKGSKRAEAWLHLGEQARLAGDRDRAKSAFLAVLEDPKGRKYTEAARLGMALLDASVGDVTNTSLSAILSIPTKDVLETQNAERFVILAESADAAERPAERDLHASRALDFARADPQLYDRLRARLDETGARHDLDPPHPKAPVIPPGLREDAAVEVPRVEPDPEPAPAELPESTEEALAHIREVLASDDRDKARELAEDVLTRDLDDEMRSEAELLLRMVDGAAVTPRIGVLLPMTGKYASVSVHIQHAIEDGWSQYDTGHELLFVDSGANPASAVAALDDLVMDKGVIAVLGPLLSDESQPVADHAEALGVPLVSMSQALDGASSYDWVFQSWITPRQQVNRLLDHTMGIKQMSSFAIFAPDTTYGRTAAEMFSEEVKGRGGTITGQVFYPAKGNNLSYAAGQLGAGAVASADAIFMPEKGSRVPVAAAGLAYEEFAIGTFRPGGRGSIPLLGLSSWNAPSVVTGGGSYTRNAMFTDVYVAPPNMGGLSWYPTEAWREFHDRIQGSSQRSPSPLEALASDAARVVAAAAVLRADTRAGFRDALLQASPTSSATGVVQFDPDTHELIRDIRILSVQRNGFVPIDNE